MDMGNVIDSDDKNFDPETLRADVSVTYVE
jgi:hypothetical protein